MHPFFLSPRVLENAWVTLEPLAKRHREAVRSAVDCDPQTWEIMVVSPIGPRFEAYWEDLLGESERGERLGFAIRRKPDGRVVGVTSYLRPRWRDRGVEIGATFVHPEARSGPTNPAAKLALLTEAFANGALRVEFIADTRNARSCAAIAKLGAVREGVIRNHKITWTGYVRDSALFSIIDSDWPEVRARLERRLSAL